MDHGVLNSPTNKQAKWIFFKWKGKKRGARERGGEERDEREENEKAYTIQRRIAMIRRRSQPASAYGTRMIATATDSEPTCMRSTKHKLASGDLATKLLLQQRKQQSRSPRGEMLGDPRRLSPPNPMHSLQRGNNHKAPTGCNPSPPSFPKCPQCTCANKPTGYHLHTAGNN
jgi:hypothetical protein